MADPERSGVRGDPPTPRGETDSLAVGDRLRRAVREGVVAPRDASLWAGLAGLKALPESKADAEALYAVGPRQARNIQRSVTETLIQLGDDAGRDGGDPPAEGRVDEELPVALTAAELALSAHPHKGDGERALRTLRSRERGEAVGRGGAAAFPVPARDRVRQLRYRPHLRARVSAVDTDPSRSVGQPYLVVPATLPARLLDLVPAEQRRRRGPPDADWLADLVVKLGDSYAARDGRSEDLSRVLSWGFSKYPSSPAPRVEAAGLRIAALIAREQGSIGAYWLVERIRHLLGPLDVESLYAVHDGVIVLRNHGYWTAAKALLDRTVGMASYAPMEEGERALLNCVLLSLTVQFFSGQNRLVEVAEARQSAHRLCGWSDALGSGAWTPAARRAVFEVEFAHARLRCRRDRERFWLHQSAETALRDADRAMWLTPEPIWRAQWALLKLRLGMFRRDTEEVLEAAESYQATVVDHRWIARDMPSEAAEYERYRHEIAGRDASTARRLTPFADIVPAR